MTPSDQRAIALARRLKAIEERLDVLERAPAIGVSGTSFPTGPFRPGTPAVVASSATFGIWLPDGRFHTVGLA